jgi:Flp pilus assembly protein CpaB
MVVVAARDLAPGEVLAIGDVKLAPPEPGEGLMDGFSSPVQVEGLTVLTDVSLDEPIPRDAVAGRDSRGGAALGVTPGLRAVSVHVADSTGVISMLRPGYKVDAQVVLSQSDRDRESTLIKTVLQNLQVLRVEENVEVASNGSRLPVVTLLARPEDADILGVADAAAQIRLLLRHPLDDEITGRDELTLGGAVAQPIATPQPASTLPGSAASSPVAGGTNRQSQLEDATTALP